MAQLRVMANAVRCLLQHPRVCVLYINTMLAFCTFVTANMASLPWGNSAGCALLTPRFVLLSAPALPQTAADDVVAELARQAASFVPVTVPRPKPPPTQPPRR